MLSLRSLARLVGYFRCSSLSRKGTDVELHVNKFSPRMLTLHDGNTGVDSSPSSSIIAAVVVAERYRDVDARPSTPAAGYVYPPDAVRRQAPMKSKLEPHLPCMILLPRHTGRIPYEYVTESSEL